MAWSVSIWKIFGFPKVSLYLERFVLKHATAHIHKRYLQAKKKPTAQSSTFYFFRASKIKRACLFPPLNPKKNKNKLGIVKNVRKFVRVRKNVREKLWRL
jgi:hypothetical protein